MDNAWKFVLLVIVFPFVYLFFTMRAVDLTHQAVSPIGQFNIGAMLGVLLYIALKNKPKS